MSFTNFWKKKEEPCVGVPISLPESVAPISISQTPVVNERASYDQIMALKGRERSLQEFAKASGSLAGTLSAIWSKTANTKQEFIFLSNELRKFYIYNTLLDVITDDVLNPNLNGEILEITTDREDIKEHIDELVENIDLDWHLSDVVRDTLDYGDYALGLETEKGSGVVKLNDTVDQLNILAMYEGSRPSKFLLMKKGQFVLAESFEYAHFLAGSKKLRYQIENVARYHSPDSSTGIPPVDRSTIPDELRKELPDYIRVGEPMFRGMASKIRDLQLLEQLMPATKLNQLTMSQFISVKMPNSVDPKDVMEVLHKYEDLLNVPVGINVESARITLAEILSATQKTRVIPDFSDGKGQLNSLQLRGNQTIDDILNAVKDIREVITTSLGIPPSVLFGSLENRAADLRKYSRYVKRIQVLRRSIVRAVEHIILVHLAFCDVEATKQDFKVSFKNSLIDVAELENMELEDSKQAMIRNSMQLVNAIQANPLTRAGTKPDKLLRWFRTTCDPIMQGESFFMNDEEIEQNAQSLKDAFNMPIAPELLGSATGSSDMVPGDADDQMQQEMERNVLLLRQQGKGRKEIALALGVDVDQIDSIVRRAKRSENNEQNTRAT